MASDSTAKKLDPDNIRDVKAAFEQFDQNHNGFITSDEMKECLRLSKIAFKNDEVDELIEWTQCLPNTDENLEEN